MGVEQNIQLLALIQAVTTNKGVCIIMVPKPFLHQLGVRKYFEWRSERNSHNVSFAYPDKIRGTTYREGKCFLLLYLVIERHQIGNRKLATEDHLVEDVCVVHVFTLIVMSEKPARTAARCYGGLRSEEIWRVASPTLLLPERKDDGRGKVGSQYG